MKVRRNRRLVISTWALVGTLLLGIGSTPAKNVYSEVSGNIKLTEEVSKIVAKGDKTIPEQPGYEAIAQNNSFIMYYNPENADVMIVDKKTNKKWTIIPENWENDAIATGALKMNLASAFILEVYDEKMKSKTITSYAASVKKGTFNHKNNDGRLEVNYILESDELELTMEFFLTENGLSVRVPVDKIKENGKMQIGRVKVLPFFGAAELGSEGYLLIPDGSGAIVEFKDVPLNSLEYGSYVYGRDESIETGAMPMPQENFSLPIFGIKNSDDAILGIVESGDYNLIINAGVAGNYSSYYRAYPIFEYKQLSNVVLFENTAKQRKIQKLSPSPVETDMVVNYNFINGEKANYIGMAETYRENLLKRGMLNKSDANNVYLNLELLGSLEVKDNFMGIPYNTVRELTSFEDAKKILEELKSKGIDNINVTYKGFNNGGYMSKITDKIKLESKLGSNKDFKNFLEYSEANNVNVILETELLKVYKEGNSFTEKDSAVRSTSNVVIVKNGWDLVTGTREYNNPNYLLSPTQIESKYNKFLNTVPSEVDGVSIEHIGSVVYSQGRSTEFMNRDIAGQYWNSVLNNMVQTQKLVSVEGTNGYVIPYATNLTNMPTEISGNDIETRSVPFYQAVVHGYIPYSANASNLRDDSTVDFLKMIEYGALPSYEWIANESSSLKNTRYDSLLSGNYATWIDNAVKEYEAVNEAYKNIADQTIVAHEIIEDGVYKTTYSNNISIIVNYNDINYSYNGKIIKAQSYDVIKAGE